MLTLRVIKREKPSAEEVIYAFNFTYSNPRFL